MRALVLFVWLLGDRERGTWILRGALHGVRLARASLAVREDADIEPIAGGAHQLPRVLRVRIIHARL